MTKRETTEHELEEPPEGVISGTSLPPKSDAEDDDE